MKKKLLLVLSLGLFILLGCSKEASKGQEPVEKPDQREVEQTGTEPDPDLNCDH